MTDSNFTSLVMNQLRIVTEDYSIFETPEELNLARQIEQDKGDDGTDTLLEFADARCGAWAKFAVDVLGTQGILARKVGITAKYGNFRVLQSLPGQGGTPRESIWGDHAVIEFAGNMFDPSCSPRLMACLSSRL